MPKATKATWPSGVPVFKVIGSFYRDEIVVGVGFGDELELGFACDIHFLFTSERLSIGLGQNHDGYHHSNLKPLNTDARAMLAIAKAGAR